MNRLIGDSDWRPPFNMWDFFALMREIEKKLPPRYTKYVLVSHELIATLMEKPAIPVTVEITDGEDGQLQMNFTQHECATNASLVEQLAQARADRDQWEATAAEENAKRRELEKKIVSGGSAAITDEGRAALAGREAATEEDAEAIRFVLANANDAPRHIGDRMTRWSEACARLAALAARVGGGE